MSRHEKKSTPNVIRAQARKRLRRAERQEAREKEAAELGITVHELKQKNWEEVKQIRKGVPYIPAIKAPHDRWGSRGW